MNITSPDAGRRWSAGPFEASQMRQFGQASGLRLSQDAIDEAAEDDSELLARCPLIRLATSHVPGLSVQDARVLQFYPGSHEVAAFVSAIEQLQADKAGDTDPQRSKVRGRILRELLRKCVRDLGFYQSVRAEIGSRPTGCSDHYEVLLDDLDRLTRLGTVQSPQAAATTVLREVCLKHAMHVACELGGSETVTTYGVLAHAFDAELRHRFGDSGSIFQSPQFYDVGAIDKAPAARQARAFLDAQAAAGYPLARQEAADWPAWMTYAAALPEVRQHIQALESAAAGRREAAAGHEEAEYAVVIDKDEQVVAAKTAPIAHLLAASHRK